MQKNKSFFLIDISSFIFRAFFAIRPLTTSKGIPVNAVYGVTTMLLNLLDKYKPEMIACIFDTPTPSFRKKLYEDYKSNRGEPPDDLKPQFELIRKAVEVMGIKCISVPGYEADDIIATLTKKHQKQEIVIVTGDKDLMQLVNSNVSVLDTMKNIHYREKEVREKLGVDPQHVTDYLGLIGDSSDNIPGVEGIGPKTAVDLITQFGSLEKILESTSSMKPGKRRDTLESSKKIALLSKELATVKSDLLDEIKDYNDDDFNTPKEFSSVFVDFLRQMEFKSLANKYSKVEEINQFTNSQLKSHLQTEECSIDQINNTTDLSRYFDKFSENTIFYCTWEITAESFLKSKLVTITMMSNDKSFRINLDDINRNELIFLFVKVFCDKKFGIFSYDIKPFLKQLLKEGIPYLQLKTLVSHSFDLMLAHYIWNVEEKHDYIQILSSVGIDISNIKNPQVDDLKKIYPIAKEHLDQTGLNDLFQNVELPLSLVLAEMEKQGVYVNRKILTDMSDEFSKEIENIQRVIFKEVGEEFNLNSPKQLGIILFDKLKLPVISKTKTGYSTDAEVLLKLSKIHQIPEKIIRYRELTKLKSTYLEVIPDLIESDGRVHAHFNQAVTATGRLSSSDPNLQNIPIKTTSGRKIRKAFTASDGNVLVGADYSQIELRIVAELSGDKNLISAFENNYDVHTSTAAEIFHKKMSEVSERERAAAKAINFGLIYGKTAFGLSQELSISRAEAQEYIDTYFKKYSGVKKFMDECIERARKDKISVTYFKRIRRIKDIDNKNMAVRNNAERMAMNTPVQGTAADIIKMAMIKVAERCPHYNAKFILSVHDEIVLEVDKKNSQQLKEELINIMENIVPEFKVKLKVSANISDNWMDL